jgi:hypothetical protein
MCFNLFGPLNSGNIATRLMRLLPSFPQDATVTDILFEHAPPKEHHLKDLTSFDVLIFYERPGGRKGFVGVETKLSEPFSQKQYEFEDRYARWMDRGHWWWQPGAEQDFSNKSFNQLWRNHLLAYAMLNQKTPDYAEGYSAVVYPLGDTDCGTAIEQYCDHLLPSGKKTLIVWSLETIAGKWGKALKFEPEYSFWFDSFQSRYLRLEQSEAAWLKFQGTRHA